MRKKPHATQRTARSFELEVLKQLSWFGFSLADRFSLLALDSYRTSSLLKDLCTQRLKPERNLFQPLRMQPSESLNPQTQAALPKNNHPHPKSDLRNPGHTKTVKGLECGPETGNPKKIVVASKVYSYLSSLPRPLEGSKKWNPQFWTVVYS